MRLCSTNHTIRAVCLNWTDPLTARAVPCREDFRLGCESINSLLPAEEQILEVDHLLGILDFDHSDSIEINEFFEVRSS